jgi:hypothetical protein
MKSKIALALFVILLIAGGFVVGRYSVVDDPANERASATPTTILVANGDEYEEACSRLGDEAFAVIPAWTTGDALVAFNNKTQKARFVTSADWARAVASGQFEGALVVHSKRYPEMTDSNRENYPGPTWHYYIIDSSGKQLADLGEQKPDLIYQPTGCR